MIDDDILRGVREAREAFAKAHGYDIQAMGAYLRKLDEVGDRQVVRLAPQRPATRTPPESETESPGQTPSVAVTPILPS